MDDAVNLNDHAAIMRALDDPMSNQLADAMAERIHSFAAALVEQAEQEGRFPRQLLLRRPATAFDHLVILLTLQSMSGEVGHPIDAHWVPREER